ncbi:MAG: anti-sigma factor [Ilumatobacteraceae bacterium]
MMSDDHRDELLGAYALDAVDDLDRQRVEAYLAEHPEARTEVWQMRQAASMLAHAGTPAPEGVWDRIADTLDGRSPRFDGPLPSPKPAAVPRRSFAGALAAAAVLIAAVAGVGTAFILDDEPEDTQSVEEAYETARDDPDGRLVNLASEDGTLSAEAVLQPDGVGFLSAGTLPELPASETYQLWGVYSDGDVISLGVVGNRPAIEPFAADGELDALVITREAAGGVVSSTSGALLVGEVA